MQALEKKKAVRHNFPLPDDCLTAHTFSFLYLLCAHLQLLKSPENQRTANSQANAEETKSNPCPHPRLTPKPAWHALAFLTL